MFIVADDPHASAMPVSQRQAATDPIDAIRDYNLPIPTYKHPPTRQDFIKIRRPGKNSEKAQDTPDHPPADDGHVDEYA